MNFERLICNIFYVFGSWALIHFAYLSGYVAAKDDGIQQNKWKTLIFILGKTVFAFVAFIWISILSGFGFDYGKKFITLEGFIQAVIVLVTPIILGILKAIREKKETKDQENSER